MKKFLLVAALFAAVSMNAKEIVVDLSATLTDASSSSTATGGYAEGVLNVDWNVVANNGVSGVEIPIDNLEKVTGISFDYKGDGTGIGFIHYLRDSQGHRWWDSNNWKDLSSTDWKTVAVVPSSSLWDGQAASDFVNRTFVKVCFVANPSTPTSGTFSLRNVVITVEDGGTTDIDNTAVEGKAVKVIRDGQVLILRDGKTFNALGAEVK